MEIEQFKKAKNDYPILEIFQKRWSPRAFSSKTVNKETINSLIEAARWAPSAMNEQPWKFHFALNNTEGFTKLWECLMPGNQPWAKNAAVLMVTTAKLKYTNGNDNAYALHDLGIATSNILHQAMSEGIYAHVMAGIDKTKLKDVLHLDDYTSVACMVAIGYLDSPDTLEEPYKTREMVERTRKPLNEILQEVYV